jgi:hypothetical protein
MRDVFDDEIPSEFAEIPNSTPAELRIPTSAADLREITRVQRTMESLEEAYAAERIKAGKVVFYHTPDCRPGTRHIITRKSSLKSVQRRARRMGWR